MGLGQTVLRDLIGRCNAGLSSPLRRRRDRELAGPPEQPSLAEFHTNGTQRPRLSLGFYAFRDHLGTRCMGNFNHSGNKSTLAPALRDTWHI